MTETDADSRDPRRRVVLAVLGTAALVAAIAVAVALATAPGDDAAASGGNGPGLRTAIGIDWRLDTVQHESATYRNTASRVRIAFNADGSVVADDGINYYGGSYSTTATGFVMTGVAGTLVGYAGNDPGVLATQGGMDAILGTPTATVDHDTLVLSAKDYTLTFHSSGPATPPDTAPASPTSTGTPTDAPATYVHGSELPATGAAS